MVDHTQYHPPELGRKTPPIPGEDDFLTHDLVDRIYHPCGLPPLA